MKKQQKLAQIVLFVVLLFIAIIVVAPFVWMVSISFDRMANIQVPFPPTFIPDLFFPYLIMSLCLRTDGLFVHTLTPDSSPFVRLPCKYQRHFLAVMPFRKDDLKERSYCLSSF